MVIITIAFKKGGKGYDYLLLNPDKAKIDKTRILKIVTGSGPRDYVSARAISARKTEILPNHVTRALRLYDGNKATRVQIPSMPAPKPKKPEAASAPLVEFMAKWIVVPAFQKKTKSMKGGK